MTEADIRHAACEAAAWWYCNHPQLDEAALARKATNFADMEMYGDGGATHQALTQEFFNVQASWHTILRDAFRAEYRRLQSGKAHGQNLITDLAEIRKTLDGLPAITPDIVLCPTCWTRLQWLQGAQIWSCDGCHRVFTPEAVTQRHGREKHHG